MFINDLPEMELISSRGEASQSRSDGDVSSLAIHITAGGWHGITSHNPRHYGPRQPSSRHYLLRLLGVRASIPSS